MMREPRGSKEFQGLIWICVSDFEQNNAPSWQGEGNRHYDRN
jgi:hypothetical protein